MGTAASDAIALSADNPTALCAQFLCVSGVAWQNGVAHPRLRLSTHVALAVPLLRVQA